ncbi:antigen-presenting glycoprotein CD1d2-like [Alligator mississippiensis]|uniref:antigen-presenting glycoprotein CD1d2-like n=1 Tax=Alligator mississippiensis TaxID=8496 RepID=UPI002877F05D|nr:antigen-presenting glycoprotein CD1d2-like [Alligator mississippiensis]
MRVAPQSMLPPLFLLLLLAWTGAASPPVPTGSGSLHLQQTTIFQERGKAEVWGLALVGDVETHTLDCATCPIRFLQPWVQSAISPEHWHDLELLIHLYLADFIHQVNVWVQQEGLRYPFVTQCSVGCELLPSGASRGAYNASLGGEDLVSFSSGKWVAQRQDKLALHVRDSLNRDKDLTDGLEDFLNHTCIQDLQILLRNGKEVLERQERPVAVVFAQQPPAASELPLLLVCRVTGFYPRLIHVAWLRDGEELPPGPGINSTGLLPNADLTYQLRSVLAVDPGAGHRYACHVEHSSLGGHNLIIPWESRSPWKTKVTVGILVTLLIVVMLVGAMAYLQWRRRRYQDISWPRMM